MKSIKKTLQSDEWQQALKKEASEGNEDASEILKWMKKNRWLKTQKHLPPRPFLQGKKPDIEV